MGAGVGAGVGAEVGAEVGRGAVLRLVAWCAALAVGTVAFHALGAGALAPPPLDPGGWLAWADGRDPLVASVALLRLVVLALHWYLVAATAVGIVGRLLRAARLVRLADAVTLPVLRRLLEAGLGLWLVTALAVSAAAPRVGADRVALEPQDIMTMAADGTASGDDRPTPAPPLGLLDDSRGTPAGPSQPPVPPFGLLDDARGTPAGPSQPPPPPVPQGPPGASFGGTVTDSAGGGPAGTDLDDTTDGGPAGTDADDSPPGTSHRDVHVVVAGDSFWRIAEQRLLAAQGRPPTDAQVLSHMEQLIERNRDRLTDPANPDLIFPGQRLVLPPVEVAR